MLRGHDIPKVVALLADHFVLDEKSTEYNVDGHVVGPHAQAKPESLKDCDGEKPVRLGRIRVRPGDGCGKSVD